MLLRGAQFRAFAYYSAEKEKPVFCFVFFTPNLLIHCTAIVVAAAHGVVALCIEKNRLQPEPDKAPNLGQSGSSGNRAGETLTVRDTNTHDLHSYTT